LQREPLTFPDHHHLRPGKPPESQLDGGEVSESGQGFGKVLEVLDKTPVSSEPGEGALDHPAARQDDKTLHVVAPLDDLRAQRRHFCHRTVNLPGVVAAISPDQFEPGEAPADFVEDQAGPVAVLDRGRVGDEPDPQRPAVDQGMDLSGLYLLAGVVTHLPVITASFSADLTTYEIALRLTGNMERFIWGFDGEKFSEGGPIELKCGKPHGLRADQRHDDGTPDPDAWAGASWTLKFAHYLAVVYEGRCGQTASLARQASESTGDVRFVFGVRVWF
jgi:Copper resistance protein B precursor (CopB)